MDTEQKTDVDKLHNLEVDFAVIKSNYATKTDIAEIKCLIEQSKFSTIKWVVGTVLLGQLIPFLFKHFGA